MAPWFWSGSVRVKCVDTTAISQSCWCSPRQQTRLLLLHMYVHNKHNKHLFVNPQLTAGTWSYMRIMHPWILNCFVCMCSICAQCCRWFLILLNFPITYPFSLNRTEERESNTRRERFKDRKGKCDWSKGRCVWPGSQLYPPPPAPLQPIDPAVLPKSGWWRSLSASVLQWEKRWGEHGCTSSSGQVWKLADIDGSRGFMAESKNVIFKLHIRTFFISLCCKCNSIWS